MWDEAGPETEALFTAVTLGEMERQTVAKVDLTTNTFTFDQSRVDEPSMPSKVWYLPRESARLPTVQSLCVSDDFWKMCEQCARELHSFKCLYGYKQTSAHSYTCARTIVCICMFVCQ